MLNGHALIRSFPLPSSAADFIHRPALWKISFEHITLAWGRDFSDVTPLRGVINGGGDP
jgi:hypothetical protein